MTDAGNPIGTGASVSFDVMFSSMVVIIVVAAMVKFIVVVILLQEIVSVVLGVRESNGKQQMSSDHSIQSNRLLLLLGCRS